MIPRMRGILLCAELSGCVGVSRCEQSASKITGATGDRNHYCRGCVHEPCVIADSLHVGADRGWWPNQHGSCATRKQNHQPQPIPIAAVLGSCACTIER